jgi:PAS domain S-box-containing protein
MEQNTELVTRTEAALRASEALKTAILETALDAIVTIDHTGRVLDFNPAAEQMFGYTRAEALGVEMAELIIPPRLRGRHRMGLSRAVASGHDTIVGQRIEISAVRKSGEEFPVELAITRIRVNGSPLFTGHIRDITGRKRTEMHRATQLAVTRVLAEAGSLAEAAPKILQVVCENLGWDFGTLWRVDKETAVLRCVNLWHAGGARLDEFEAATRESVFEPAAGLPGRIWANTEACWIPDVVRDENFPRAPLASREGLHAAFGFPIRLGDQVLGVVEFFSREIREPNAELLEMFSTIGSQIGQFIERKRGEEKIRELNAELEKRVAVTTRGLRESEERFSKAFRASPVFISIARLKDGKFVEANEAFLQSGGWTREEVIGRTSADLGIWANLEDRGAFLIEVQLRGFVRNREVTLRSKGGKLDTVLLSAERIDIDGEPCVLAVGLNITARKRAEEDMRRALEQEKELSRLKTNFVTLVSHEFRTPLGIIMSATDILKKYFDRLPPERRGEHLQDIHGATRRMADLMDEVLLLARVEAGKMECKPMPLDLAAFCRRLIDEVDLATAQPSPIVFSSRRFSRRANADESLLRHIFANLLSNAVKYSAAGTPVEFIAERADGNAVFTVRDRGIGIPAANLPELFQTFLRGANVGERPGTGLGLVIVRRCVELHGGKIQVESKEGIGTTVIVTLPLFSATNVGRKRTQRAKKRVKPRKKKPSHSLAAKKSHARKKSKP